MPNETIPYKPSNGGDGVWFELTYCGNCTHQNPDPNQNPQCNIKAYALCCHPSEPEYPKEWVCDHDGKNPCCKAHNKWNWQTQGNPNDPTNPNYINPHHDPAQLTLNF